MPIFYYKAKDREGRVSEGIIEAASDEAVADLLLAKNLVVVEISQQKQKQVYLKFLDIFRRVSTKELVIFFRQLSVLISANIPVVRALRTLVRQTKNANLKKITEALADEVEGGATMSSAMEAYPQTFGKFYVNIVRSGETSGRLSEVMNYLADQKEKDYDLESRVKGAMYYPAFILAVLAVVGFIVLVYVVPKITVMLAESGAKLPLPTRILMGTSGFFVSYWYLIIGAVIGLAVGYVFYARTPGGRRTLDLIKIKIPIFGNIFKNIYIVRICRSFATLLKGGVTVSQSLEVVKDVVDNKVYEEILQNTINSVNEGNPVSESLSQSPHFPLMVPQMISVGEETGRLDEVLERIAEFYSREIDASVRNLSSLIEPIIMVVLGIGVAFFVAAILLPIWQLSSSYQG